MHYKSGFSILLFLVVTLFSVPAEGYVIFQLNDGRVLFFGNGDRENIFVCPGNSPNGLRFNVSHGSVPGNVITDHYFDNVTGIYADFGGCTFPDIDSLDFHNCTINGDVEVTGADASYQLRTTASAFFPAVINGDLSFYGTSGIDSIVLYGFTLNGNLHAEMKQGADGVRIDNTDISGNVSIQTGAGNDWIGLYDSDFGGTFSGTTLGGVDDVTIDTCTFDNSTTFSLGGSNDEMLVLDSTFRGFTRFDGGSLFDEGNQGGNTYLGRALLISSFENGNFSN